MSAVDAALLLAPAAQSLLQHRHEQTVTSSLRSEEMRQGAKQHTEAQEQEAQLHCEASSADLARHNEAMELKRKLARREAARDVWSQQSQYTQTLILIDALMFGCAFATFSQGIVPPTTALWLQYIISLTISSGVSISLLSMVMCMKVQSLMNAYRVGQPYTCGKRHYNFDDFFDCHCKRARETALVLFYVGAVCTLASLCSMRAAKYIEVHDDKAAAILVTAMTCVGVVVVGIGASLSPNNKPPITAPTGFQQSEVLEHERTKSAPHTTSNPLPASHPPC